MITVGRICVKTAGRDAGKRCIVVEIMDKNYVRIAGETRSRKCNIAHLEPLAREVKLKGSSEAAIAKAVAGAGFALRETKAKKAAARPRRKRSIKVQ